MSKEKLILSVPVELKEHIENVKSQLGWGTSQVGKALLLAGFSPAAFREQFPPTTKNPMEPEND